jgi:hypothetical protein
MRWLLICLFVSVGALLLAAVGVARHIWLKRTDEPRGGQFEAGLTLDAAEDADVELEM